MIDQIKVQVKEATQELLEVSGLKKGDIFVLGGSSSEVVGGVIGKASNEDVGFAVVDQIHSILKGKGIYLAVQGCEHINRALVIERDIAETKGFEIVNVVPALHAGGAMSMAAYKLFEDPVVIEHVVGQAGLDIGDTSIGMHIKFVQVPVRLGVKNIGQAHLTALRSRPKLVGGERALHY